MSAERRLAKLEADLPPRQAVLRWLLDAHRQGSFHAYVFGLLDEPRPSPVVAIADQVTAAARAAHASEPRTVVREAEGRATMDTVFLLQLVLELEHEATEVIRIGSIGLRALLWESRARTAEGVADRQGWAAWRTGVRDLATDLARCEAVRRMLEARFLDGREVLFPVTLAAWAELQEGVAALLAEVASRPGSRRQRPDHEVARVAQRTAPQAAGILVERDGPGCSTCWATMPTP